MSQVAGIVQTLKHELKSRQLTYAWLATQLDMSEANIKKMFAENRFTLCRIEQICELIGLDILQLIRQYEKSRQHISYLDKQQEQTLIADSKLLLVAVCVLNGYRFDDILHHYKISETECIRKLAQLDRLKLIELLANNKFRLLIDEDFHWIPGGPIEQFFEQNLQTEFLQSRFTKFNEFRQFRPVLLSEASQAVLLRKAMKLSQEVSELQAQDQELPLEQRHHTATLIAIRPWVFSAFAELEK